MLRPSFRAASIVLAGLVLCCSSSPPPATQGGACSSPGQVAVKDACTACVCESSGHWSCQDERGDCAQCPTSIQDGDACGDTSPITCTRYAFCASPCTCAQGHWRCLPVDCGAPGCPNQPSDGSSCSSAGFQCHYFWPVGCTQDNCTCSGGQWSCTVDDNGCVDAG